MAAEQGFASGAVQSRSRVCTNGRGVPKNDAEAARWFRMAAEQGICHGAVQSRSRWYHEWSRRSQKRCRGSAVVSHGRRAGICQGAVQSRSHVLRRAPTAKASHEPEQGLAAAQFILGNNRTGSACPWYRTTWPPSRDSSSAGAVFQWSWLPRVVEAACMRRSSNSGHVKASPRMMFRPMPGVNIGAAQIGDEESRKCFGSHRRRNNSFCHYKSPESVTRILGSLWT